MTDPSTDSTVPVPIVMSQPDPAPFWAWESWRRRLRPGYGVSTDTERGRTRGTPAASLLRHASTAWRWPGRPIIPRRYRPAGTCLACTSARPVAPHPWCRTILGPGARPGRGLDRRTIDRISCGQAPRPRLRDKLTELAVGVAAVDRAEPTPGGPTGGRAVIPPYECRRYWRRAPPGAGDNAEASLVGGTSE